MLLGNDAHFIDLLGKHGYLIISGIIEQNREEIESHFFAEPLFSHRALAEKEWLCYVLRKEEMLS